jgi:hypothetical protein
MKEIGFGIPPGKAPFTMTGDRRDAKATPRVEVNAN